MTTVYETGHAKNVANFQKLIEFATSYGATYNPSKQTLQISQLTALKTSAESAIGKVLTENTIYNNKVNERQEAFSNLRSLSTRLINALQSTDATEETISDAKLFNRKIQGKKASKTQVPVDNNTPVPNTISASQQSYDQLIQHFTGLISVLEFESSYKPNEVDLQVVTLKTKLNELVNSSYNVATAYTNISNSRIARNEVLYTSKDALVETANDVKKYIKSVFGASSAQYHQVSDLEFKKFPL